MVINTNTLIHTWTPSNTHRNTHRQTHTVGTHRVDRAGHTGTKDLTAVNAPEAHINYNFRFCSDNGKKRS